MELSVQTGVSMWAQKDVRGKRRGQGWLPWHHVLVLSRSLMKLCCKGRRIEQHLCSSFLHVAHNVEMFRNVAGGPLFVFWGPQMLGCRTMTKVCLKNSRNMHY